MGTSQGPNPVEELSESVRAPHGSRLLVAPLRRNPARNAVARLLSPRTAVTLTIVSAMTKNMRLHVYGAHVAAGVVVIGVVPAWLLLHFGVRAYMLRTDGVNGRLRAWSQER